MQNIALKIDLYKKTSSDKSKAYFSEIKYFKHDVFQSLVKVVLLIFTREFIINHICVLFSAY